MLEHKIQVLIDGGVPIYSGSAGVYIFSMGNFNEDRLPGRVVGAGAGLALTRKAVAGAISISSQQGASTQASLAW